ATANLLENEFYTLTFDPASGTVTSIVDRELKQELLDPAAPHRFNQIVWVSKNARESKEGTNYSPTKGATLTPRTGALVAEMESTFKDAKLGDAVVSQRVRLYAGIKRIDVVNELLHVGVLHAAKSANRYRDNLFFAFPFKVDGFTARAEQAGGVVRPYDDQLRWGTHDYLTANRWVDVSNGRYGITMAPHNAPIVHFGAIRYNELSISYKPEISHLYSFAWSNRMAGLFTLCADDMNNRFTYSFSSHAGDWNSGATTRFGWSVASPLEARVVAARQKGPLPAQSASFLAVDVPNVQLTVLKDSGVPGRGWTLRLVETEGKGGNATLDVSRFPVDAAMRCDLVENDQGPLAVSNGKVTVPMGPFSFATIRIFARASASPLPAVASVTTEPKSDANVALRWPAVAGAVAYNVFRSVDPKEPASAYSLVGRATAAEFLDAGLHVDTTYFYKVAAVGKGNAQGMLSAQVQARTLAKNVTPPHVVGDFGIVRQTADRLMVCWSKNTDPDVARYLVYRGTKPDFTVDGAQPVATVRPSGFYLEHHVDTKLQAGQTYYYRVLAEDWAGNRQTHSLLAFGTTPLESP
ncbi:MAG: glycoside hydrolase family 38 C-terminal domain-containing protein, partial [Verrucomicrobiota bacterium]